MSRGVWESVHGGSRKWFPDHLASGLVDNASECRAPPQPGSPFCSVGAAITHRRAADAGKAVAAALLALAITIADLAVALTSSA